MQREVEIEVATRQGERAKRQLELYEFSLKERQRTALKAILIGLGLALAFVFIPILHFFLVPAALIVTPLVAWRIYQRKIVLPAQKIICPYCGDASSWGGQSHLSWPAENQCEYCRGVYTLSVPTESSPR